jgi:Mg-chelatase subunit ChlD
MAAARSVVEIVGGRSVQLGFERGASCADVQNGRVNLDGEILEADLPWIDRMELVLALASHEGAHLARTTPEQIPRDALFKAIGNVLEDERIEAIVVRELPEFAPALEAARARLLRPASDDGSFLSAVFTLVRCPGRISDALWHRYAERLEVVVDLLSPYPESPEAIRHATLRVALLIPPEQRDELPPSWEFAWASTGGEGDGEGELDPDWEEGEPGGRGTGRPWPSGRRPRFRGRGKCGPWPEVVWREATPELTGYNEVRARLGRKPEILANRIQQMLPRETTAHQTTGRIDKKRLHAYRHRQNLFRAPNSPERIGLSIVVMLDLSGSMAGRSAELAREIGVLLCEAVRQLAGVRIEVYGHDADVGKGASTRLTHYPIDSQGRAPGLGELDVGGNNRDAHAIRVLGETLRASPLRDGEHKLAILVADGAPSATDFNGEIAREKTRDAILWLEQTWGPVLFVATDDIENLKKMVPGPSFRFRAGRSVDQLAQQLTLTLRRAVGGVS